MGASRFLMWKLFVSWKLFCFQHEQSNLPGEGAIWAFISCWAFFNDLLIYFPNWALTSMFATKMARLGYFLTLMPQTGIKLTPAQLHLFWGTLIQDTVRTELPRPQHLLISLRTLRFCLILSNRQLNFSGGLGQLGSGLARLMRRQFGRQNVILSDIIRPSKEILDNGNSL